MPTARAHHRNIGGPLGREPASQRASEQAREMARRASEQASKRASERARETDSKARRSPACGGAVRSRHRFPATGSLTFFHFCTSLFSGASLAVHDLTRADGTLSHKAPATVTPVKTPPPLQLSLSRTVRTWRRRRCCTRAAWSWCTGSRFGETPHCRPCPPSPEHWATALVCCASSSDRVWTWDPNSCISTTGATPSVRATSLLARGRGCREGGASALGALRLACR